MTKLIYLAHPFRNDPNLNTARISAICREIHKTRPDLTLISPIHNFAYLDPETDVTAQCLELLSKCDMLWVCGDWTTSEGCKAEIAKAQELHMSICYSFMDSCHDTTIC